MDPTPPESVVLVDVSGTPIGTALKESVHGTDTPLHLAFSCHVTDAAGRVLVTRRAIGKRTFPGVWSNAFCGHPAPGEELPDAVRRRASRELGVTLEAVRLALPGFRYRAADAAGVVENEICPVFVARASENPVPARDEVDDWAWVDPDALRASVSATPFAWSPWLVLQLDEWDGFPHAD